MNSKHARLFGIGGALVVLAMGFLAGRWSNGPQHRVVEASSAPPDAGTTEPEEPFCETGESCTVEGQDGTCARGVCVLPGGRCSRDIDCGDGRACTRNVCRAGECVVEDRSGGCQRGEDEGLCRRGYCEPAASCTSGERCPEPANPCAKSVCSEEVCEIVYGANQRCTAASGAEGVCTDGRCDVAEDDLSGKKDCERMYDAYYGEYRTVCKKSLAYVLPEEEREQAERDIEKRIAKELRYDMAVTLVAMPEGGYNIVAYNRHERTDVRGICDPSLVAFTVANYTLGTNWKSRALHVWLNPLEEGWGIATAGSREAVRKGQQASELGFLGVVDIEAFRDWLDREFEPLEPPTGRVAR